MGLSVLQVTFHKNKKGFVEYLTPPWCSFQMNQLQLQQPQWRRRQQQPQRQQRRQPRVHPLLGLQWVRAKDLAINTLLTLKVVRVMFNQSNRDFKFEFLHCWSRQKPKLWPCVDQTHNGQWRLKIFQPVFQSILAANILNQSIPSWLDGSDQNKNWRQLVDQFFLRAHLGANKIFS